MSKQTIYCGDCLDIMHSQTFFDSIKGRQVIIVTDPPFNVSYHYNEYSDNMDESDYYQLLDDVFLDYPFVVVHYPESIYKIAFQVGRFPERVCSWVYNSNTARQHRDVAFFGVAPDFSKVKQPYKNPNDKRIAKLIESGGGGASLYDWWNVDQIKNVSREKTEHPCQMPVKIMENIVGLLPEDALIVDPFCGSGTTGVACKMLDRDFIGIELNEDYANIAVNRLCGDIQKETDPKQERWF